MLLTLLLAGVSLADDPHADARAEGPAVHTRADDATDAADPSAQGAVRGKERGANRVTYEVALRGRFMSVPTGVLDLWYTRDKDDLWPLPPDSSWKFPKDRPVIQGVNYGLELAFRNGTAGGLIFFDWVDSQMTEGYWDDRDEDATADDFRDGDYIVPASNVGLIMFGGDYQYELPLIKNEATAKKFQLHFVAGAGLGLAILVGKLDRYKPGANDEAAFELYAAGEDPNSEKEVPRVWPVVDVNLGFKFEFAQRFTLRLEGGLHTLLYGGAAVGYRF